MQASPAYFKEFEKEKITYAEIAKINQFTIEKDNYYVDTTAYILGSNERYLVALLNSKLFLWQFSKYSSEIRGGYWRWKRQYMQNMMIYRIDPSNASEVEVRDSIVEAVEELLELQGRLPGAVGVSEAERLRDRILYLEGRIDVWIYGLYGLNAAEISVVEGV